VLQAGQLVSPCCGMSCHSKVLCESAGLTKPRLCMCRSTAGPNWLPFSFGGKSLERAIGQRLDGVLSRRVQSHPYGRASYTSILQSCAASCQGGLEEGLDNTMIRMFNICWHTHHCGRAALPARAVDQHLTSADL
jgi:hypothetical protein